jgi:endo-1,4-beta-xylanase
MTRLTFTAAVAIAAIALTSCGGGGDSGGISNPPILNTPTPALPDPATAPALKTVIAARYGVVDYPVGAAIEPAMTIGADATLLIRHVSSITAENAMKPDTIWPNAPGTQSPAAQVNFAPADQLAAFANANGMRLRGHTLLWHRTAPTWFFAGDTSDPIAYRAGVRHALQTYIFAVVQHFPNVYAWDVVNEVATDTPNAANPYRTDSPWYTAYSVGGLDGRQYVRDAFVFADEARTFIGRSSASMKLMLNDYNTELPGKRANVLAIVQDLVNSSTPIDGVGHQFHLALNADVAQVTAAFTAVEGISSTFVNHVTELDVSIYADPGSCYSSPAIPPCLADYGASPPQSALSQQATLYRALYTAFNRPSVTSVTTWGIADNHTWLNSWPVTRTNRPLLFDTNRNPKWAFWAVVDPTISVP